MEPHVSDAPMSAGPYASNSLGWQLRQTAQRVSQWLEYQLAQLNPDINPPTPQWPWITALGRGLFWTLAVGLALWLSWLLYRRLLTDWRRPGVAMGSAPVPPADSTHSLHHWWQQAQAAARQGHYEAACQALYLGALQRLHVGEQVGNGVCGGHLCVCVCVCVCVCERV